MPSYGGIMLGGHKVTNIFYQCNIFSIFFCDGTSKSTLRGGQVVLADIEVINFDATSLGCSSQRCQFTDWRFGHFESTNGNFWHNTNCSYGCIR